jgi:predicted LPLAT superfamily acyltransferase
MAHWSEEKEKARSLWPMKLLYYTYKYFGKLFFRILLYPVVLFFFLFSPSTRRISRAYLERIHRAKGDSSKVRLFDIYWHIFSFSYVLLEKQSAWAGDMSARELLEVTPDIERLKAQLREKKGAVIIASHLGNIEMLRAFASLEEGSHIPEFGIHSVVDFSGTAQFNRLLKEINPKSMLQLVDANNMGADTIIRLQEGIEQGDLVIIAGDRTAKNNRGRSSQVSFLGEEASFPTGAFVLASLLEGPVYYMFALRTKDRDMKSPYEFHVYKSVHNLAKTRKERKKNIEEVIKEYVSYLESLCLEHPSQWYNFFDFWEAAEGNKEEEKK